MLHYLHHHRAVALVLSLLALAFLVRNYIRDLTEIARTYATFKHLHLNIYTFPRTEDQALQDVREEELAPRILHQIFLREGRNSSLARYQGAIDSCRTLHPSWEYRIWGDDDASQFVSERYPDILPHYKGYEQTIQRTNILRYLLLHYYGGVYLDLDITCRAPLDQFLHLPWLSPAAYPAGINNAFLLSRPQHPFLTQLIEQIPGHDLSWPLPYVENMLTTGCMFISNMWMRYMRRDTQHGIEEKLFVLADQHGGLEAQMLRGRVITPLFEHGGASSWHGWDAAFFVIVGQHYVLLLLLVVGSAAFMAWLGLRFCRTQRATRRKSLDDEEALLIKLG